jgi:hypothetical protein
VEALLQERLGRDDSKTEKLVNLFHETPVGNRKMHNVGYSTLSMAAQGAFFLHRLNPNATRGGIRLPTEEQPWPKVVKDESCYKN